MDINVVDTYDNIEYSNNVVDYDGTQAILMDGQYYIPTNMKPIFLPENEIQFVSKDIGNNILSSESNEENELDNNTGIIQFVHDPGFSAMEEESHIVYYSNDVDTPLGKINTTEGENNQFTLTDDIEPLLKRMKFEGEFVNVDTLLTNIDNTSDVGDSRESKGYQYFVQFTNSDPFELDNNCTMRNLVLDEGSAPVDISKITGKNLLTGQRVTLDSYLKKVRNCNKEISLKTAEGYSQNLRKKEQHTPLSNLLNKKLTIGKTLTGQRLIGKVIHVGKKEVENSVECTMVANVENLVKDENIEEALEPDLRYNQVPSTVILEDNEVNDCAVEESLDDDLMLEEGTNQSEKVEQLTELNTNCVSEKIVTYVWKTLTNLMDMESVAKKMKRKNLLIKVNQKIVQEGGVKVNIFQMRGYLEMLGSWEGDVYQEKWQFKLDPEGLVDEDTNDQVRRFPETMRITISIVQTNEIVESTKVNLNYNQEKCSHCSKEFRSLNKLHSHLRIVHKIFDHLFYCQLCEESLNNKDMFDQHQQYHVDRKELFPCTHCDKHLLSEAKLRKHMLVHDTNAWNLTCSVCGKICSKISSWRKHMLTHTDTKPITCVQCCKHFFSEADLNYHMRIHDPKNCYVCGICNRTFSRYSNLQRHLEIHGTKNSKSVFRCSICGCTYNYVSSLTRHIVRNHRSIS